MHSESHQNTQTQKIQFCKQKSHFTSILTDTLQKNKKNIY